MLANIYLHYTLDMWFEKAVKPQCRGQAILMRFADDFVCCFQYRHEVQRFYNDLGGRMRKFKLELSAQKTQVIRFTRFETKSSRYFTFLGFDYRWGLSRTGKPLVKMRTNKKKFRASLAAMRAWIKKARCKFRITGIFRKLKEKLQGHYNYYGVCGNCDMLSKFYKQVRGIMYKWLNRRSQRKSYNWQGFKEMWEQFSVPRPRIIGYWN